LQQLILDGQQCLLERLEAMHNELRRLQPGRDNGQANDNVEEMGENNENERNEND